MHHQTDRNPTDFFARLQRAGRLAVALAMLLILVPAAAAQDDEQELGWSDEGELGIVATAGNSESTSFRFKNTLTRSWETATFKLEAGGILTETTTITRRAVGTEDDFRVFEEKETNTSAEHYHLKGSYEREITQRLYWHAGAGWERNVPAGIAHRYSAVAGVGNRWIDREDEVFVTDYGVTFTNQEDVLEAVNDESFLGLRFSLTYERQLTDTTRFDSKLVLDENLDDTDDYRGDLEAGVAVAINDHLALKASAKLLYDNRPALEEADLELPDGSDSGIDVLVPKDEVDSHLGVSLVVTF